MKTKTLKTTVLESIIGEQEKPSHPILKRKTIKFKRWKTQTTQFTNQSQMKT